MHKLLLLLPLVVISIIAPAFADTIHIPADYTTIQEGIDAAIPGDIVMVASGTYVEQIDFIGKDIVLTSELGPEHTIIDGGSLDSVVTFENGEGPTAEVRGFTIRNGLALTGGGIYCLSSNPTIGGNIIENNSADYRGGGIYCSNCSPLIADNIIRNNHSGSRGGGFCTDHGAPRIVDNVIDGNLADSYGGGIFAMSSNIEIRGNVIANNEGSSGGGGIYISYGIPTVCENTISNNNTLHHYAKGGGIQIEFAEPLSSFAHNIITHNAADEGGGLSIYSEEPITIEGNEIAYNTATYHGGGIECRRNFYFILDNRIVHNDAKRGGGVYFDLAAKAMFTGNTVAQNTAVNGGGLFMDPGAYPQACVPSLRNNMIVSNSASRNGGGLYCEYAFPRLENTTVADNSAVVSGGGIYITSDAIPEITNGIVWNNSAPVGTQIRVISGDAVVNHTDIQDGWPGTANIATDPFFADAANNDYHLTYDSPCRDAGDNAAVIEAADFEGDIRIAFGTVDMGADEFYNHLYCIGEFTPGGSIEGKFVGLPGTSPVGLFIGSGVLDPPLSHLWGDFYLEAPWLLFPLIPVPANGVLSIPAMLPALPAAPYDIPMQALIGNELTNLFVIEVR